MCVVFPGTVNLHLFGLVKNKLLSSHLSLKIKMYLRSSSNITKHILRIKRTKKLKNRCLFTLIYELKQGFSLYITVGTFSNKSFLCECLFWLRITSTK